MDVNEGDLLFLEEGWEEEIDSYWEAWDWQDPMDLPGTWVDYFVRDSFGLYLMSVVVDSVDTETGVGTESEIVMTVSLLFLRSKIFEMLLT